MPLINTKYLNQTPFRVQRLLIRLMRFNCVFSNVLGKDLVVADALSMSKVSSKPQTETTMDLFDEVEIYTEDVTRLRPALSQML